MISVTFVLNRIQAIGPLELNFSRCSVFVFDDEWIDVYVFKRLHNLGALAHLSLLQLLWHRWRVL